MLDFIFLPTELLWELGYKKNYKTLPEKLGAKSKQKSLYHVSPNFFFHFKKLFGEMIVIWLTIIYNPQMFEDKKQL